MTTLNIEEKLEHFQTLCFKDARERSEKMLEDYTVSLKQILENHKNDAKRQADMQLEAAADNITREMNKQLSIEQINIKREYSTRQEELKSRLMTELRDRLARFMETPDYQNMLEAQVKKALEFAGKAPITIYLDPADSDKLNDIAIHTGAALKLSEYSFLGGTRAVIPSRNILIDHSFQKKLEEAEASFKFRLGGR